MRVYVNLVMINSAIGAPWALATILVGASVFNIYYYWKPLNSQITKFRDQLFKNTKQEPLCSNLF
ncbi:MAG: hypothetical protein A4S09_12000 [Proteobacteria bacterium SG_bin7]|nr:MAG: hypothetical protein A4S09_12000 [Proteobacteria bacterium SG_bin7]